MSKRIIREALLAALICMSSILHQAVALEPVRAGQESSISRAIFSEHKLWLLTDAGVIFTVMEGADELTSIALPGPAFDLWGQNGEPTIITGPREGGDTWTIRKWEHEKWVSVTEMPIGEERFIAAGPSNKGEVVLTSRRLIEHERGQLRSIEVAWPKRQPRGIASMHVLSGTVLLGMNAGEFGGGLISIDRATGSAHMVERKAGDLCRDGILDSECDPVTGIADEPGHIGCVVVSIGLVHFLSHGRVLEVCGVAVREVYSKKQDLNFKQHLGIADDKLALASTTPFFGAVAREDAIWSVSRGEIYRIAPDGSVTSRKLPKFEAIGPVSVSFLDHDFVLVLTSVNQRHSLSGSVPFLVPR